MAKVNPTKKTPEKQNSIIYERNTDFYSKEKYNNFKISEKKWSNLIKNLLQEEELKIVFSSFSNKRTTPSHQKVYSTGPAQLNHRLNSLTEMTTLLFILRNFSEKSGIPYKFLTHQHFLLHLSWKGTFALHSGLFHPISQIYSWN